MTDWDIYEVLSQRVNTATNRQRVITGMYSHAHSDPMTPVLTEEQMDLLIRSEKALKDFLAGASDDIKAYDRLKNGYA